MKVLKFGGTSVGSVESIKNVKEIVEAVNEPVIVVVSALGGITDKLINMSKLASKGDIAYKKEFEEIVKRHYSIIEYVVTPSKRTAVLKRISAIFEELENIFVGVFLIKDLSPKTSDTIVSYGERLSSYIVTNIISNAKLYDSRLFIKTYKQFNKHVVDFELTNQLIKDTFSVIPDVAIVPGFISSCRDDGEVTNLGRGGSDYTASILAAALDASTLEIWTDVDGFMTADPKIINSAYVIEKLSYTEA
ncbi:MAG: bifunctional aspartate kinase/homoserine dehydrogenase I, partial [Tannerella sp.]|nr:bifunctional aspartate kinase/homoserine dehydrogenase I [Tannerella sp.]